MEKSRSSRACHQQYADKYRCHSLRLKSAASREWERVGTFIFPVELVHGYIMHTLLLKKTFNQRGESWGASDGESKSPVLNGFVHLCVLRSLPADVVSTLAASSEHSSWKQDRWPFREQAPWREVGARQGWVGAAPGRPEEAAVKGPGGGQVTPGVGGEARPLFWRKTLWAEAAGGQEMAGPGVALGGAVDRVCWRAGYTRGGVGAAPKCLVSAETRPVRSRCPHSSC